MKIKKSYLNIDMFKNYPVISVFSTRLGGISRGIYQSMNLGFTTGDEQENILKNYKIFANDIGVEYEKIMLSSQKHNDNILIADQIHQGMGITKKQTYDDIDGIYTECIGLPIVTLHADCTPIFFYDKNKNSIGLVHSGWRGTAKQIAKKMIRVFVSKGSKIEDIISYIGPAICKNCYEVGDEVLSKMPYSCNNGRYLDLKEVNRQILLDCGVLAKNIGKSSFCTKCDSDLFFSHRLLGNKRGSNAACMCLR